MNMSADQLHAACSRVVAFVNGKGGVLKTSSVANVAGQVADAGHKVLVVDLDPQANLFEDFGITQAGGGANAGEALFDAVTRGKPLVPSHPQVRPRLDLVGADSNNTDVLIAWLARHLGEPGGDLALARALAPIAPEYDLVLIDVPPVVKEPRRIAMGAARYIVIPTQADDSSLKGLRLIAEQFVQARHSNPQLTLLGILLALIPASGKAIRHDVRDDIARDFGTQDPIFDTVIRHAISPARDARKRGVLAHELENFVPTSKETFERLRQRASGVSVGRAVSATAVSVSGDYARLTEEMLTRIAEFEAVAA